MVKEEKATYNIKGKLTAAIAMLLVAVIMVVSSTYAWFTLSTAPEVTGISTAVGANGALEMMLFRNDSQNGVDAYNNDINTTWGNLVDLKDNALYGSDKITLYPSELNIDETTGLLNLAALLSTPVYGADGRVSGTSNNTVTGTYGGTSFTKNDGYGFRAVGVASGMSDRQLAYRDALSAITINQIAAQTAARQSLAANGTALANIAVNKGVNGDNAKFTHADVLAVGDMIDGVKNALVEADQAYVEIILAYVASSKSDLEDAQALVVVAAIETAVSGVTEDADPGDRITAALGTLAVNGVDEATVTSQLDTFGYTDTFLAAVARVDEAYTAWDAIEKNDVEKTDYTWGQVSGAITKLLNVDEVMIDKYKASEVMNYKNEIAGILTSGQGLNVYMPSGSGVYADIADLSGDYSADVEILSDNLNVGVDGLTIKAKMNTQADTVDKVYFPKAKTLFSGKDYEPEKEEGSDQPLSEFYGYILDLVFRTNAPNSNLLLQADGVDRIYEDQTTNESTLGGGSYMVFQSSVPSFTVDQVKELMGNIRIVFFDTVGEQGFAEIYAYARLDVNNGESTSDGYKAKMIVTDADGNPAEDNVIKALGQNDELHISALVYLDGTTIENADVAATAATSMVGKANFQFASDATLVPMEYADLHPEAQGDSNT